MATAPRAYGRVASRTRPAVATTVLMAALAAVAAELVVQRVLVRVGIHIPALPFLQGPYRALVETGSVTFPAATLLVGAALAATLLALTHRMPGRAGVAVAVAAAPFPLVGAMLGLADVQTGWEARLASLYLIAAGVAGASLVARQRGRGRAFSAVLVLSLALGALATVPEATERGRTAALTDLSEAGILAAAILAPFAFTRRNMIDRTIAALAGGAGLTVLVVQLGNTATTNILMLWGLGLTGSLPFPLYSIAAGALVLAMVSLVREGRLTLALGLAFVALGGLGLHNTYQSTVQILGLCVLALATFESDSGAADPAERRPRRDGGMPPAQLRA